MQKLCQDRSAASKIILVPFTVLPDFSSVTERINDALNRKVAKGTNKTHNFKRLLSGLKNFLSWTNSSQLFHSIAVVRESLSLTSDLKACIPVRDWCITSPRDIDFFQNKPVPNSRYESAFTCFIGVLKNLTVFFWTQTVVAASWSLQCFCPLLSFLRQGA